MASCGVDTRERLRQRGAILDAATFDAPSAIVWAIVASHGEYFDLRQGLSDRTGPTRALP